MWRRDPLDADGKRIERYFSSPLSWLLLWIPISIFLAITNTFLGIIPGIGPFIAGVFASCSWPLMIVSFLAIILISAWRRPPDEEIDQLMNSRLEEALEESRVLDLLGLLAVQIEQEPLRAIGPFLRRTELIDCNVRRGKDNRIRCSAQRAVFIALTEDTIHAHECIYDAASKRIHYVHGKEYDYKDIVSVHRSEELVAHPIDPLWSLLVPTRLWDFLVQVFKLYDRVALHCISLHFRNGEHFEIPLTNQSDTLGFLGQERPGSSLQQLTTLLRTFSREQQQRALPAP